MKQESMQRVRDGLCVFLNYLLVLAAVITISDLFRVDNPNLPLWIVLVIVPLGFFYWTKKTPQLIPAPIFVILLAVMSMAERIMTTQDWSMYYNVIAFIYLMGYFLFYFANRFLNFLKLNQNTASKIPIADIFRNGMGLTVFFATCSSVILLITFHIDWVKAIADRIWRGILMILSYIFSGIKTEPPIDGKEPLTQNDPQLGGANMSESIPQETLDGIRDIMIVLLCVALVIGFILFLYYVYYVIKGLEGAERAKGKKGNLLENDDVREHCGIEKNSKRKTNSFVFRNNREKIRQLYQKNVMKHKKELIGEKEQSLLSYLTAKECCDKLSKQQLKLAYEKARYSEEVITAEDVKSAK